MNEINKRIADAIAAKGIKKSEVARQVKVSPAFISQLCSGAALPSDRTIIDIARVCGVNEIWLRTGEGDMFQAMTENEELSAYAGDVLAAAPDDIRKRFLAAQAKWTPDMWAVFAKIVDSFTETKKPDTE